MKELLWQIVFPLGLALTYLPIVAQPMSSHPSILSPGICDELLTGTGAEFAVFL